MNELNTIPKSFKGKYILNIKKKISSNIKYLTKKQYGR